MKTRSVLEAFDDAYETFSEAWGDGTGALRGMGGAHVGPRTEAAVNEAVDPVVEAGSRVDN